MTANLIGTWDGTLLADNHGNIPSAVLFALRLSIETQGPDEKSIASYADALDDQSGTRRAPRVSTVYGHISLGGWDSTGKAGFDSYIPVAGFVDDAGVIKLSRYETDPDSPGYGGGISRGMQWGVYVGRVTRPQFGLSIISGNVGYSTFGRITSGNKGPDTFSVKRLGLDFSDRTFLHIYEHIPF